MNRYITVLIFLLASVSTFAQTNWHFEQKIERQSNSYLYEGTIADKYPITMYLEEDGYCLREDKWHYSHRLKGWYYYNDRKIKIPLIGSEKYYDINGVSAYKITLYAPTNILEDDCGVEKFNEIFVSDISFESMQWKTSKSESFLPVKLKKIRRPLLETNAFILLYIRNIEMISFNLTDNLKGLRDTYNDFYGNHNYIDQIDIKSSKEIDNDFYLIFSFSQPSVPNSNGFGQCGAGYEEYLGFLHISSFEVKEFKYAQTFSCFRGILEEYTFDADAPEKGIITAHISKKNPLTYDEGVVINEVKWATRNVDKSGTFAAKPEDAGIFYQWYRKFFWSSSVPNIGKPIPAWDTTTLEDDTWEKVNDPSPVGWRLPTLAEIKSLFDTTKVSHEWTTENGVSGRKFTDKVTGNTLFLPAAGSYHHEGGTFKSVDGYYWSSTAHKSEYAYYLKFNNQRANWSYAYRRNGFNIRAVAETADSL